MPTIEAARVVQHPIQEFRLGAVAALHRLQSSDLVANPARHQQGHVDREYRRRVQHRVLRRQLAIVQHRVQSAGAALQQVAVRYHQGEPRRPEVLLRAGIEHAAALHRQRTGEDVRGGIADRGHRCEVWQLPELGPLDGLVGGVVDVGGTFAARSVESQLGRAGHAPVVVAGAVPEGRAVPFRRGLAVGLVGPIAAHHVLATAPRASEKVHRDQRKLLLRTALQQQHLVLVADAQQRTHVVPGLRQNRRERFRAMADLDDGSARSGQLKQCFAGFFQYRQRQRAGTGGKVVQSAHGVGRRAVGTCGDGITVAPG